jgi:DnaJ-domain-containing protein 1
MIIWGSRGVTSSIAKGSFHCPKCDQPRSYEHKKVRRFFTLYFIPLFPMANLGDYVECQTCKGTYKEAVLHYDPKAQQEAFRQEFDYALQRALVLTMLADGSAQEAELQTLATLSRSYGGPTLGPQETKAMIAKATADTRSLAQHFGALAAQVNTEGKERLLEAAVRMAVSDGSLQPQELDTLATMARALGVSDAHLKGIVSQNTPPPA